ncbi:MAG: M14 family zinc carboxypeptidase [Lachnospiraceae bacterium]|nr:M14 family zinc carboxypeptidase [Lachnospiraceae bacterium]
MKKSSRKLISFLIALALVLTMADIPFAYAKNSVQAVTELTQQPAVPATGPAAGIVTGPALTTGPAVTLTPSPGPTSGPGQKPTPAPTARPTSKPSPKPTKGPVKDNTPFTIKVKKAGSEKLAISWAKRKSANKYKVWQKKQGAKKWKVIKTTKQLKYNVKIKKGRRYKYRVTAIFGKKKVMARTENITACIPADAANILYKRVASRKVDISWKRGKCTKSFIVYRRLGKGRFKRVATVKKAKYHDDSVAINKKYAYKILPVYDNEKVKIYGSNTYIRVMLKDEINTDLQNYSYKELCSDIEALSGLYGSHFHYNIIGQSEDGRNIYDIVIGNQYAAQSVLVVAQLHAREYMTSQLCMKQIEYYLQNYNEELDGVKVSDVLNKVAIHYVPMANPDGAAISQFGFTAINNKSLRKKLLKMPGADNPSLWKANARGVDLNKNYPYEYVAGQGTRGSEGYTGPKRCSESETQAIMALVNRLKNNTTVKGQINYHATGSIVFGDYEGPLKEIIDKMYTLACDITGYTSAASYNGDSKSVGNLREFVMYKKNLPSITLEIGKSPCPLPKSEFKDVWKRNKNLVLKETEMLINYKGE